MGKRGPGGIIGSVRIDAEPLDFEAGGRQIARAIAEEIAVKIRQAISEGKTGSFRSLPPLKYTSIAIRDHYTYRIRTGQIAPTGRQRVDLRKRYRIRAHRGAQDPLASPAALDAEIPAYYTGGFAMSIRAFPATKSGTEHRYKIVAARIYDDLQQRYEERGYTLLTVPEGIRPRVDELLRQHAGTMFRRGLEAALERAAETLETATAAAEGQLGEGEDDFGGLGEAA